MARTYHSVNSFKSGELSEKLNGRFEIQEYSNGAAQIENFFPLASGGLSRRPGSQFFADITTFGACRIIAFSGSDRDYLLLLRDDSAVDFFDVYDSLGNNGSVAANYLGAAYNGVSAAGWSFAGARMGAGDRLIMAHSSGAVPPIIITFSGAPSMIVSPWITGSDWGNTSPEGAGFLPIAMRVPYDDYNRTSTTLTPSGTTGNITITASAATWAATDVGRRVRIIHGGTEGVFKITSYTSTTVVDATEELAFGATTASDYWTLQAWSDTTGWPRVVTNHNQRLVFASTPAEPDKIWLSIAGSPGYFMQDKLIQDASTNVSGYYYFGAKSPADAFSFRIASPAGKSVTNFIQWLSSGATLEFGTGSQEGIVKSTNGVFGATNFDVEYKSFVGGAAIQATKGSRSTFYVSSDGKSLREFVYSPENGSYVSRNLSILNSDLHTKNLTSGAAAKGISNFYYHQLTWQNSRNILWSLVNTEPGGTDGGVLVGLTFQPDTQTVGWHRHSIAGVDRIYGLTSLANDDNKYDKVYMVTERQIDGGTKYYIEFFGNDFEDDSYDGITSTDNDDYPVFLDCAKIVTNSPASTTVATLSHLEGEEVYAWADGSIVGPFTVDTAAITLATAASKVVVGFKYTSKLKSMDLNFSGPSGDNPNQKKDSSKILIKLYRSYAGEYGPDADTLSSLEYDTDDLYTGNIFVDLENSPNEEFRYYIQQADPYPLTILGVFLRGVVGGG